MEIWIVSFILVVALVLLITEKLPVDLTAIGIMAALMATGLLTPLEAVAGFANPAVVTVAAMFLISRGLIRTGAVTLVVEKVSAVARGNSTVALLAIMLTVAGASAFINNTPVVMLFIPIILSITCTYGVSPSKFLIPMSYASILAGTCTLIGTSTNIIVSDLSAMYGHGELEMFELAPLGVPIAAAGLLFLMAAAPRVMPGHTAPVCELEESADRHYLAELQIPADSTLIDRAPSNAFEDGFDSIELIEIVRNSHIRDPRQRGLKLQEADLILVKGSASDLVAVLQTDRVQLMHSEAGVSFGSDEKDPRIVELIVPPQSSLVGTRLLSSTLQGDADVHIIAIKSRRVHYSEQKIQNVRLRVGDILLVWCPLRKLETLRASGDFIIVEDVHHLIVDKSKAGRAMVVFAGIVLAASTGVANIMVCAIVGLFLMALGRCLRLRDAYRSLQPEVLLLIVGTIALGTAMQKTGASALYAEWFMALLEGAGPRMLLGGILLMTSISTQLLSNNATAVLILPIAISTAAALGVDPKPFIIGVCFGASACFATPIGYQTNLLVYGPGGYRFSDYLKLGIPLNLLVIFAGTLFIPILWPF